MRSDKARKQARKQEGKTQRRGRMLRFAKMHGLGNDFMVVDLVTQDLDLPPERVRAWADRRTGVGFDQLLAVLPPDDPNADFRYRVFNADGTEAEQCGNGARCFARFVVDEKLTPKRQLTLQTAAGVTRTELLPGGLARVRMGVPSTGCAEQVDTTDEGDDPGAKRGGMGDAGDAATPTGKPGARLVERIDVAGQTISLTPVSLGNPHAVVFVADVASADVAGVGAALQRHERFPEQVNVGFLQVVDSKFGRLRVYERGVGETRACGSGAAAAMVAAKLHGRWGESAKIALPGGKLRARWRGGQADVEVEGPTQLVYRGRLRW